MKWYGVKWIMHFSNKSLLYLLTVVKDSLLWCDVLKYIIIGVNMAFDIYDIPGWDFPWVVLKGQREPIKIWDSGIYSCLNFGCYKRPSQESLLSIYCPKGISPGQIIIIVFWYWIENRECDYAIDRNCLKHSIAITVIISNSMPFTLTLWHFRWHWGVQNTNYDIEINVICIVAVKV